MQPLQIAELIIGSIASLGIVFGGAGYLVSVFRKGTKQEKSDIIQTSTQVTEFYKDQIQGFKDIVESQTEKIRQLTGEIGELRGQLTTEKSQNDRLEKIFQNRNPEMDTFIKAVMGDMKHHEEYHAKSMELLGTMIKTLNEIYSISLANQDLLKQDIHVETTVSKQT
jgi:hypothetical protein